MGSNLWSVLWFVFVVVVWILGFLFLVFCLDVLSQSANPNT